jgi:hypothetical protein
MIFKFPKKKIVLDCFTFEETIIKTAPIDYAIKHIPEWWKDLPNSFLVDFVPTGTMRGCVGMTEFYRNSIAIPLWSDLIIDVNQNQYKWQFADYLSQAAVHNLEQEATNFLPKNYAHLKLISVWHFKCKEDINWMWNTPLYNLHANPEIIVPPGIVNFNKQVSTNINLLFRKDEIKQIYLRAGTPLVLMTPMSDRKVEVVRHLVDAQEFKRQNKYSISFTKTYRAEADFIKKHMSCPFKDHTRRS